MDPTHPISSSLPTRGFTSEETPIDARILPFEFRVSVSSSETRTSKERKHVPFPFRNRFSFSCSRETSWEMASPKRHAWCYDAGGANEGEGRGIQKKEQHGVVRKDQAAESHLGVSSPPHGNLVSCCDQTCFHRSGDGSHIFFGMCR